MYATRSRRLHQAAALAATVLASSAIPGFAAELMPVAQQNALIHQYCAVCHTDAAKNGGLSLEHFDAAQAPPSLTAMMLSKLTGGVSLKTAAEAPFDERAAALIDRKMKSGAMGASGIPIPAKTTIDELIRAFTVQSGKATEWAVERSKNPATRAPMLTASILREAPSVNAGEAEFYRLVASCDLTTRDGSMQLAWSPVPQNGNLSVSIDGSAAVQVRVEGRESMGNNSGVVLDRPASALLARFTNRSPQTGLPFPTESLTVSGLFPDEVVTFPFSTLPKEVRTDFNKCFPGAKSSPNLASGGSKP